MNSKLRKTVAVLSFIIGATAIFAHPDDELYQSGGTLALLVRKGTLRTS